MLMVPWPVGVANFVVGSYCLESVALALAPSIARASTMSLYLAAFGKPRNWSWKVLDELGLAEYSAWVEEVDLIQYKNFPEHIILYCHILFLYYKLLSLPTDIFPVAIVFVLVDMACLIPLACAARVF